MSKQRTKTQKTQLWKKHAKVPAEYLTTTTRIDREGNEVNTLGIEGYYLFELATQEWGPFGTGWGFNELRSEYIQGAPHIMNSEIVYDQNHVAEIEFWYVVDGETHTLPKMRGSTPYVRIGSWGASSDAEAEKKSTTDALKKSLSMLGFANEIYKGNLREKASQDALAMRDEIKTEEDKAAKATELSAKFSRQIESLNHLPNVEALGSVAHKLRGEIRATERTLGLDLSESMALLSAVQKDHTKRLEGQVRPVDCYCPSCGETALAIAGEQCTNAPACPGLFTRVEDAFEVNQ